MFYFYWHLREGKKKAWLSNSVCTIAVLWLRVLTFCCVTHSLTMGFGKMVEFQFIFYLMYNDFVVFFNLYFYYNKICILFKKKNNLLDIMKYLTLPETALIIGDKCLKINKIANLVVFSGVLRRIFTFWKRLFFFEKTLKNTF